MKILPILLFFISTLFATLDTVAQESTEKKTRHHGSKNQIRIALWPRPIKAFAKCFGGWI